MITALAIIGAASLLCSGTWMFVALVGNWRYERREAQRQATMRQYFGPHMKVSLEDFLRQKQNQLRPMK